MLMSLYKWRKTASNFFAAAFTNGFNPNNFSSRTHPLLRIAQKKPPKAILEVVKKYVVIFQNITLGISLHANSGHQCSPCYTCILDMQN